MQEDEKKIAPVLINVISHSYSILSSVRKLLEALLLPSSLFTTILYMPLISVIQYEKKRNKSQFSSILTYISSFLLFPRDLWWFGMGRLYFGRKSNRRASTFPSSLERVRPISRSTPIDTPFSCRSET